MRVENFYTVENKIPLLLLLAVGLLAEFWFSGAGDSNDYMLSREIMPGFVDARANTLSDPTTDSNFDSISAATERMFDRGSEEDLTFLVTYLETPKPAGLNRYQWVALQDRIVAYLVDEWPQYQRTEQQLLAMLDNPGTFHSVKNSIVKRLDKIYLRSSNPQPIEQRLWAMATLPANDIAAASLSTLAWLSETSSAIEKNTLSDVAYRIMSAGTASVSTQVTAIEIAAWLRNPKAYAVALDIIKQDNQPDIVKLAAISTIVKLGSAADVAEMIRLAETQHQPVNKAAREAVKLLLAGRQ